VWADRRGVQKVAGELAFSAAPPMQPGQEGMRLIRLREGESRRKSREKRNTVPGGRCKRRGERNNKQHPSNDRCGRGNCRKVWKDGCHSSRGEPPPKTSPMLRSQSKVRFEKKKDRPVVKKSGCGRSVKLGAKGQM